MRFGSLLILLFLVVIQLPAFAQADSTVSFISYWNKGESRNYKITKSKTRYKNDSLTVDETESYKINIKVVDSTATSYLIEWTYLNSLIPGKQIPEELKPVLKKYKNLTLKYRTNELGTFLELVNYKEVSKMMRKAFTKISAKDKNLEWIKNNGNGLKCMMARNQVLSGNSVLSGEVFSTPLEGVGGGFLLLMKFSFVLYLLELTPRWLPSRGEYLL